MSETSTKPYLIRALHEWCTDNGYTPYLAVAVNERTEVPREHVKAGEIVLNVGHLATGGLVLGNDYIEFQARFGGVARRISVPVEQVIAIYARENGQGMAFEVPKPMAEVPATQSLEPVTDSGGDFPNAVSSASPDGASKAPLSPVSDKPAGRSRQSRPPALESVSNVSEVSSGTAKSASKPSGLEATDEPKPPSSPTPPRRNGPALKLVK